MRQPDNKHSVKNTIFGILFLLTIIGAIIAIYITSQTDIFQCMIIACGFFGVMFMLGGLKNINRPNTGNLVFVTLGLEFVIWAFVTYRLRYGNLDQHTQLIQILPKLACGSCVLLVAVMFVGGILLQILQLKRCNQEVTATIIAIDMMTDYQKGTAHRHNRYAPRVKYDWLGCEYESQVDVYQTIQPYNVGDNIIIMLNPDNPEEIMLPGRSFVSSSVIFGILMMAASIAVYLLLQ